MSLTSLSRRIEQVRLFDRRQHPQHRQVVHAREETPQRVPPNIRPDDGEVSQGSPDRCHESTPNRQYHFLRDIAHTRDEGELSQRRKARESVANLRRVAPARDQGELEDLHAREGALDGGQQREAVRVADAKNLHHRNYASHIPVSWAIEISCKT